jgi:hypothetical protein
MLVGLDLSDRAYFKKARETRSLVFSDFLLAKSNSQPIMMSAYPVAAIDGDGDSVFSRVSISIGCRS